MASASGGPNDPMRAGAQMWEQGYQNLFEGWKQAQEFWNGMARSWGGMAGQWVNPAADNEAGMDVLRELQEAAFGVAQAWLRLPLTLTGGASPTEIQEAIGRLTEAQGRAYQLWLEALSRSAGGARSS